MGETVVISTAPHGFRGTFGYRNFFMRDEAGELLAVADSTWMLMDFNAMKPVHPSEEILNAYVQEERYPMEYSRAKIVLGEDKKEQEHFCVGLHHLDTNHHVNNGQYVAMAEQYLPEGFAVNKLRVEYRKQAMLGDEIVPWISCEEGVYKVSLNNSEDGAYAVLLFTGAMQ